MTFGIEAREWLARAIGATPQSLNIARMKGSTSSSVFLVQRTDGNPQQFVLRVLDNREWLADEPDLAAHEAAALEEARKARLRAPRLIAYTADEVGFGAPVVLMSFIAGHIELQPADFQSWLADLANELAAVHRHPAIAFPWSFVSWVERPALKVPAWTAIPHAWERAIDLWLKGEPAAKRVFIHRDYHPTNVLWQQGTVTGVVDWINACRGPAGADVAHCRNNLTSMYGPEVADQFLEAYWAVADGFDYDPYWDVDGILNTSLPRPTYYPPWQDFGLRPIPQEVLYRRVDAYLASVLRRM
jgi:aminoglycoside phosphotransferase (APT) family kinase protein